MVFSYSIYLLQVTFLVVRFLDLFMLVNSYLHPAYGR